MKIGKFTLVAIFSVMIIGIICSFLLYTNIDSFTKLKNDYAAASSLILNADRDLYQALQGQYMQLSTVPASEEQKEADVAYTDNFNQVKERIEEALTLVRSKSIDSLIPEYNAKLKTWAENSSELQKLCQDTATFEDAKGYFDEVCLKNFKALRGDIDVLNDFVDQETVLFVEKTSNFSYIAIAVFAFLIITNIILLNYLSGKIKKPIKNLVESANLMSKGDFSISIDTNQKGEVGELSNSFNSLKLTIEMLNDELMKLNQAGEFGRLDVRADSKAFSGVFSQIITGMNSTLDSIIRPLNVAAEYVDRISKGDIPPKIVEEYKGDFNEIKNNLNQCIDAVNYLVADTKSLVQNATLGKLNERADTTKHFGDFKRIVDGINSTLDRLVGLIDNLPLPVQIVDNQYDIQYVNKKAVEIQN